MSSGITASMKASSESYPNVASMPRVSSGLGPMWRVTKRSVGEGSADRHHTRSRLTSSGKGVSLTRRQHHDAGAAAHLALELLRIGLDHVPCIVMYRNHRAGLHELHGAYRVFDAHRVVVADRDEHRVHAPGEQLHLHGEARVPTVIHGAPTHHDDHPGTRAQA